jgi:hypothetical protein
MLMKVLLAAFGAAVQGAIMDGEIQGLEVLSPLQVNLP